MTDRQIQEKPGFLLALLLMLGISTAIWILHPVADIPGMTGLIAFAHGIPALPLKWSYALCGITVVATSLLLILLNRRFGFVNGSSILFASAFLVMTGVNPWIMQEAGSASLLALVTTVCMWLLFACYGKRNATQTVFLLFTIFSIGSMLQYAYLLLALAFAAGLSYMKVFRLKEFLAMLCGLLAPYWICLGLGITSVDKFTMPHMHNLFELGMPANEIMGLMLFAAIGALLTLGLGFLNYRSVFATNGQVRSCNAFINMLGIFCVWFIVFDFNNMVTYMALLNIMAGIQVAHFFNNNRLYRNFVFPLILVTVYVAIFLFTVYDWK